MAAAMAVGSCGGTSRPVWPSSMKSGMPPAFVAIAGVPSAIASRMALPLGSGRQLASTDTEAAAVNLRASRRKPISFTRSCSPCCAILASITFG